MKATVVTPNLVILAGGVSSRMKKSMVAANTSDSALLRNAARASKAMIPVGEHGRPFLDYLLSNVEQAGYKNVVIVVGERDDSIREHYEKDKDRRQFQSLNLSFAVQKIPNDRQKPLGTADALLEALRVKGEWKGQKFTVCNSDNLYSVRALKILLDDPHENAMIDYDRSGLKFDQQRISEFAVIKKDVDGFLETIIEKPSQEEVALVRDGMGRTGVSMNIFRLSYDKIYPVLESIPLHPVRLEKELPAAVRTMIEQFPKSVFAIPLSEHVPDLTTHSDILEVKTNLQAEFQNR